MVPYSEVLRVHGTVNNSTEYVTDVDLYNKTDFWTIANGFGDCEDFALAKRKMFLERGYPSSDLRLCLCRTEEKELHAVLIVKSDRGDLVLDNRHVLPLTKHRLEVLGYTWIKIGIEGKWYEIS